MYYKIALFKYISTVLLMSLIFASCEKYLDQKPIKNAVVPSTLADLQALLDNNNIMNSRSPEYLELVADNYYITTMRWQSATLEEQLNYVWDKDATSPSTWINTYQGPIYFSNVVLDQLPNVDFEEEDRDLYNNVKGSALFYRAFAFHQLAQLYCKPYSSTAGADFGIVLRLTAAIEEPSVRASVQQTYDQIINDLKVAAELLPETAQFPIRPTKAAAYGALARTYLSMRDYMNARQYADLCLQMNNVLMDYNTVPNDNAPFRRFNVETIFYNYCEAFVGLLYGTRGRIDTTLYASYDANDLRKTRFFRLNTGADAGTYRFKGAYDGDYFANEVFDGITTDEMYLTRAECAARADNVVEAMADLNTLLEKRWVTGSFVPFTANNADDALSLILMERRKELVYRGLRWSDLRRLNLEGANIALTRIIDGVVYTLPPNDPRWVLLIPEEIIARSGIPQNQR